MSSAGFLTLEQVRYRLEDACEEAGGIRAWADINGLHASLVDAFFAGQRGPGPMLLAALGLESVTVYRVFVDQKPEEDEPEDEPEDAS